MHGNGQYLSSKLKEVACSQFITTSLLSLIKSCTLWMCQQGCIFIYTDQRQKYINKIRAQVILKCLIFDLVGSKGKGNCRKRGEWRRDRVFWGEQGALSSSAGMSRVFYWECSRTEVSLGAVRISCHFMSSFLFFLFVSKPPQKGRKSQTVSYSWQRSQGMVDFISGFL